MKRRRVENFIGTTHYKYHSTGNHYPSAYKIMIMIIVAMLASILLYYNIDIYLVMILAIAVVVAVVVAVVQCTMAADGICSPRGRD